MRELGTTEIGQAAAQLVMGASESVSLMGFMGDPLFNWHSGVTADDVMAMLDERLPARAVLRRLDKVVAKRSDLLDSGGRMEERRERNWRVRIPPFVPPAHLLLVDRETAIYADLAWSAAKNDSVFLVEDPQEIKTLLGVFEAAWSAETGLLYRDPFGGVTAAEETRIITVTAQQWQRLIDDLAANPKWVHDLSSRQFEELVAELMSRDGMDVQLTPPQKDGGRDVLAYLRTPAGEHLFYVECKRYSSEHPVGVRIVRELFGVVEAERATAGLLVTTSRFTDGALRFREAVRHRMSLKDFEVLAAWLQRHTRP